MVKKTFILLGIVFIGIFLVFSSKKRELIGREYCPFCHQEILESQKFYEDSAVIALGTHKPVVPGHCLIIPKRHIERFEFLEKEELLQIQEAINTIHLATKERFGSSYLLLQKNGREVGQSVAHVHVHYIPRQKELSGIGLIGKMFWADAKPPLSLEKKKEQTRQLKQLLASYVKQKSILFSLISFNI